MTLVFSKGNVMESLENILNRVCLMSGKPLEKTYLKRMIRKIIVREKFRKYPMTKRFRMLFAYFGFRKETQVEQKY